MKYSKNWANKLLKWFLREVLYSSTWKAHPYYKILIGNDFIDRLEEKGYPWQAERIRNHLHRWMKLISCTRAKREVFFPSSRARDTLSKKREREVSS